MLINDMHRAVLAVYADGDFQHLAELDDIDPFELGDSLLTFLLVELSAEEDCEDLETGISRIAKGKDDLDVALQALWALERAIEAKQLSLQFERLI